MLGKNGDDMIGRVRKAQEHLYPTKIAADGTIMEWVRNSGFSLFESAYDFELQ